MKVCTKCQEEKPLTEFTKAKWGKDGLNSRCRQCASTHFKQWREENPDVVKSNWQRWYAENAESQREKARIIAASDPARRKELLKAWRKANPEYMRCANGKRRSQIKDVDFPLTHAEWLGIIEDFMGLCFWCGADYEVQDHLIPLSKGGTHTASNVVPSCQPCNKKYNKDPLEFLISIS